MSKSITERDKFLTEAMGLCWHEGRWYGFYWCCSNCDTTLPRNADNNIDFDSWPGFGILWEWSLKQEWWISFISHIGSPYALTVIQYTYINPSRFADAVFEFLKERKRGSGL